MAKKPKVYKINCAKCETYILTYHKYGAGKGILRLYFSNIHKPIGFSDSLFQYDSINQVPNLQCSNCDEVIGIPTTSKSDKWVFRMKQGYFHRKLKK